MQQNLLSKIIHSSEPNSNPNPFNNFSFDFKVVLVFLYVPLCLTIVHYFGSFDFLQDNLNAIGANRISRLLSRIYTSSNNLGQLAYWFTILFIFYFLVPVLMIKFIFKDKLSDFGLKFRGAFKDYYLYLIMLGVMIPLVLFFSRTQSFQSRYPFLHFEKGASLFPDLLIWEIMYCIQFFVIEFFFRGFVLFGLQSKLGVYSVFIMTIPYCMVHFGKPMPETIAAIIAGVVLGFLSLKNRSVYLGCLIHITVGLSMDIASLWHKGYL